MPATHSQPMTVAVASEQVNEGEYQMKRRHDRQPIPVVDSVTQFVLLQRATMLRKYQSCRRRTHTLTQSIFQWQINDICRCFFVLFLY